MTDLNEMTVAAFAGPERIAAGSLREVAAAAHRHLERYPDAQILVFDRATAAPVEIDLRGDAADVAARLAPPPAARGRPKLGVTPREVTLLPRHWDWLAAQPGGASVTLRRLVEAASKAEASTARARTNAAYRFMSAMAGDLPRFEEAARALFASDWDRLDAQTAAWPADIRDEIRRFLDL